MPVSISELINFDPYNVYTSEIKGNSFKSAKFMDALMGLSQYIRTFIFESEMPHQLKDSIAIPFKLDEKKSSELAKLLMEIILGWVYLGDVIKQIGERLQLDQETAKQIAAIVINQIFQPILPQLKQMHIQKFSVQATPGVSNQSQAKSLQNEFRNPEVPRPLPPRPPVIAQPKPSNNVVDLRNKP
ncbi:MAG: hypothetical protein HYW77_02785 [Parcubacteria group bacterium]|nr:hypothetical protein [Parcubacteria group bacterium]